MIKISIPTISGQISNIICLFLASAAVIGPLFTVYAQTEVSTDSSTVVSPTKSQEDLEIQTLKEKIATKVAELRGKNNKAVSGTVQELITPEKMTKLKIKTWRDEDFGVKIDPDLTKFYQIAGVQKKEIKSNTIKKNSYIIVTGVIKEKEVEANFVYLDELFFVASGKVTEVNRPEFFIRVVTADKENYTLDVETFTKQQMLNIKTLSPESVSFSKIKEGDTIHFVLKKTSQPIESNRFAAQKILIIPQEYFIK